MKRKNRLQALACGAAIFAFVACTDVWDEHYQLSPELNAEENLWELISRDDDLQEFAAFLQATKYDSVLMMTRSYTVWAPADGSGCCDTTKLREAMQSPAKDSLLEVFRKEIVENHIANFSHVAGDIRDKEDKKNYERILVLNGKLYHFEGSYASGYRFSDSKLKKENIAATNGVLHKLEGSVGFAANIWEQLAKEEELDSLWRFLNKDYKKSLNMDKSELRPIIGGGYEVLYPVWDISCRWFNELGQLNAEDSSYTMYALNNDAWNEMFSLVRSYYVYRPGLTAAEDGRNSEAIGDSVTREMMCRNLLFSNTVNKKYFEGKSDTLRSTTYRIFEDNNKKKGFEGFDEARALTDASINGLRKSISLSNGTLNIVDQVNYQPWTWGYDTIRVQGESLNSTERYKRDTTYVDPDEELIALRSYSGFYDARQKEILVSRDSVFYNRISGKRFGYYAGLSATGEIAVNPVFNFYVDNVLSASYCIKIVMLPPDLMKDTNEGLKKPNKFQAELQYLSADGKVVTAQFAPVGDTHPTLGTRYPSVNKRKCFLSDYGDIDTIVLAERFTFPVCEANLNRINNAEQVSVKLRIEDVATFGSLGDNKKKNDKTGWKYDNSYRIDEVIFEPIYENVSEN